MRTVTTSRGRVAAQVMPDEGQAPPGSAPGPTAILFHSLLADRGSFDPVLPRLSARFRLVVLDLPGFGGSERVAGGIEDLADHLAEAVRLFAPGERPILVGNGFGSFLALAATIRAPGLAGGLYLAGCGAAFNETGREAFRGMARGAAAGGLERIADIAMRRLFPPALAAASPEVVAERRARFVATDPEVLQQACGILSTLDLREGARGLDAPLLAAAGEWDEATPPAMAEELAALAPRGRYEPIRDCAHVPTLQAPDAFCTLLEDFAATRAEAA